jgi:uncharacterized protein YecT (DUF1311 family)
MSDFLNALKELVGLPPATLFILLGVGFWFLAIVGSVAGRITMRPPQQVIAGVFGTVLIILGLAVHFGPYQRQTETTTKPSTQSNPSPPSSSPSAPSSPVSQSPGPSFDCKTHHQQEEVAICNSATLSRLDRQLYGLYTGLLNRSDIQQTRLKVDERAWLSDRHSCLGNESCLTMAYERRIEQLRSWR